MTRKEQPAPLEGRDAERLAAIKEALTDPFWASTMVGQDVQYLLDQLEAARRQGGEYERGRDDEQRRVVFFLLDEAKTYDKSPSEPLKAQAMRGAAEDIGEGLHRKLVTLAAPHGEGGK